MKKQNKLCLVLVFSLVLIGCFNTPKVIKIDKEIQTNEAKLEEEKKQLTSGVDKALTKVPESSIVSTNPETKRALTLAKTLSEQNVQLHGLPIEPLDINALLAEDKKEWDALMKKFDDERAMLKERARLTTERGNYTDDLIQKGMKYEEEQKKNWFSRLWGWVIGTIGIGGLIALVVLCPALLPVLGSGASWLIGAVPQLMNFLGIVGKSAVKNIGTGVENFKRKVNETPVENEILRNIPDDKSFTKVEVLKLLEEHSENIVTILQHELSESMDSRDKNIIRHITK